jgi:hypothetical protein
MIALLLIFSSLISFNYFMELARVELIPVFDVEPICSIFVHSEHLSLFFVYGLARHTSAL